METANRRPFARRLREAHARAGALIYDGDIADTVALEQTTDAATWYVDVREQYLPSGYSMFSTLQAISGDSKEVGPFAPALTYDGDIADTAALEQWISGTVVSRLRSAENRYSRTGS